MITFNKLFEVALGSRRPKSTYFCLQIELDCSSSNCISKTCNSIQSNIVKYNKFFKISKRIWIFYTFCCIFKPSELHKTKWKIVRWLRRLSLKIRKSEPFVNLGIPFRALRLGFLALKTIFSFTKLLRKYVDVMADCNKISLKFAHISHATKLLCTLSPSSERTTENNS